jgi:hypothetical protein
MSVDVWETADLLDVDVKGSFLADVICYLKLTSELALSQDTMVFLV